MHVGQATSSLSESPSSSPSYLVLGNGSKDKLFPQWKACIGPHLERLAATCLARTGLRVKWHHKDRTERVLLTTVADSLTKKAMRSHPKSLGLRHAAGYFGRNGTTYCRQAPAISNTISHPAGKMNVYGIFF